MKWPKKEERTIKNTSLLLKLGKQAYGFHLGFLREALTKSYNFTGKGVATYSNGDIYDGHFFEGVRIHIISSNVDIYRSAKVKKVPTSISQSPLVRMV